MFLCVEKNVRSLFVNNFFSTQAKEILTKESNVQEVGVLALRIFSVIFYQVMKITPGKTHRKKIGHPKRRKQHASIVIQVNFKCPS